MAEDIEQIPGLEEIEVEDVLHGSGRSDEEGSSESRYSEEGLSEDFTQSFCVGKLYTSWEAIEAMYKAYAMSVGFGVARCQSAYLADRKTKRAMTWRCEHYGDPDKKIHSIPQAVDGEEVGACLSRGKTKKRKSKKCNCVAMLYCARSNDGVWVIKKLVLEHSGHSPIPDDSKMVKEYRMRFFTDCLRKRIINDVDEGVSIAKIHGCIARERDGLSSCPITEKDIRHIVDERRRLKMQGGDANALLKYLKQMKKTHNNFYNTFRADENGMIKDILWADSRSRAAYEYFGEVICFDTTYLTNKYHLPFANFVGVNHHGQSVLLGCALVSHEDCETFEWVFREWLECMGGKAPDDILTDQAAAMQKPIADVFPKTRHRWCLWHILRKFPNKFSTHERYDEFKEALMQVVYDSFTEDEFCHRWGKVLVEFKEVKNTWLRELFNDREMWSPVYLKDQFWAGMRTTQRVESINSFFDKFVTRQTRLCEFGERYIAAVERRVKQEKDADALDRKHVRSRVTGIGLERFYRSIYIDAKYRAIQRECDRLLYVVYLEKHEVEENKWEYVVEDRIWKTCKGGVQDFLSDDLRCYTVFFNSLTLDVHCACFKFETEGILCRHAIRILDMNRVYEPPSKYILERWRKDLVRRHSEIIVSYHDLSRTGDVSRLDNLSLSFQVVAHEACLSNNTTEIAKKGLQKILLDIRAASNTSGQPVEVTFETPETADPDINVLDPPIPKKKRGRPKGRMNPSQAQKKRKSPRKRKAAQKDQLRKKGTKTSNVEVATPKTKRRQKKRKVSQLLDDDSRIDNTPNRRLALQQQLCFDTPDLIDVNVTGPSLCTM